MSMLHVTSRLAMGRQLSRLSVQLRPSFRYTQTGNDPPPDRILRGPRTSKHPPNLTPDTPEVYIDTKFGGYFECYDLYIIR